MKPVYSHIRPKTGAHVAGIISVQAAPREWLTTGPVVDFNTGRIISPIELEAGRNWLKLEFTPESYDFEEKPKSSKSGSFYELSLSGTTNDLDADTLQSLETYRYHELVMLVKDRQKRTRIIGDKETGLVPQTTFKQSNNNGGSLVVSMDLTMQQEFAAPFYDFSNTVTVGLSPVFLVPLYNNNIEGDIEVLRAAYQSAVSSDINQIYSIVATVATEHIINVAFANSNGQQINDFLLTIDTSSLQGFIAGLQNWMVTHGTGQTLVLQGNQLRVVDNNAAAAYFAIAIPMNLFGDDTALLAAW